MPKAWVSAGWDIIGARLTFERTFNVMVQRVSHESPIHKGTKMKVLSKQEISQVSGGESLIDAIHRYEWNSYGVPLANAAIFAYNATTKVAYLKPIPKP